MFPPHPFRASTLFQLSPTRLLLIVTVLSVSLMGFYFATAGRGNFDFNPSRPFKVDFGRGSGMSGLNTVAITEDGSVNLFRHNHIGGHWERTTMRLTPAQLRNLADAIARHGLAKLNREYRSGAYDGTQWVLWIRQDDRERTSYFDNEFPSGIVAFSRELDEILLKAVSEKVSWENVGAKGTHDDALWESIRR